MKTILLVEDDPFISDIYSSRLREEDFTVDIAKDGQMALEKIKDNYYDLVVLDILLPKMDGWQVLKALRSEEKTKNLKVVVISNLDQQDYAQEIADFGVIKYFLKIKTTPEEITNTVKEILK